MLTESGGCVLDTGLHRSRITGGTITQMYRLLSGFKRNASAIAVGILSLGVAGTAQALPPLNPGQALIDLTGTNGGASNAGVYTSPYTGTITPYGGTAVPTVMICDDYYDNTYLNESWVTNVTNAASLSSPSTTVDYNGSDSLYGQALMGGLTQAKEYTVVAYLATEIVDVYAQEATAKSNQLSGLQTEAGDLGFALWDFTNTGQSTQGGETPTTSCLPGESLTSCNSSGVLSGLNGGTTEVATIMGYISQALTATSGQTPANYANVNIYTYAGEGCSGATCPPPPQEFITVSMDEPSMPLLFGFYGVSVICLGFVFRRRIASKLL